MYLAIKRLVINVQEPCCCCFIPLCCDNNLHDDLSFQLIDDFVPDFSQAITVSQGLQDSIKLNFTPYFELLCVSCQSFDELPHSGDTNEIPSIRYGQTHDALSFASWIRANIDFY